MQVTVDYTELQRACKLARKVVGNRSTLPVLAGIRLEVHRDHGKLEMTATDLETTIRTVLDPAEVAIDGPSVALVPVSALAAAVKGTRPKATTVTLAVEEDGQLHLRYDGLTFRLRQLDAGDYPPLDLERQDGDQLVTSSLELVRTWAERVLPACSDDQARPVLTAVHIERTGRQVAATATDTYRLHTCQGEADPYDAGQPHDCSFLLPASALRLAQDAMKAHRATTSAVWWRSTVDTIASAGYARLEVGPTTIVARCVEGEFPPFEQVFPASDAGAPIAITDATAAAIQVRLAESQAAASHVPVVLERSGDATVLASVAVQDVGTCELPIVGLTAPEPFDAIGFTPAYLRELLEANGAGTMRVLGPLKPAVLSDGNGFRGLLMPVRLSS